MTAVRAKAPTLAWLLTALTCLLAGMAIVESRHQAVALPVWAPVGSAATAGATAVPATTSDVAQTTTPEPPPTPILGPGEELAPARALLVGDGLALPAAGGARLRVERLALPPGTRLPPEAASGPTVLLVEVGALSVRGEGAASAERGFYPSQFDAPLSAGERLAVAAGTRYAVRNDGQSPAVALVVTIAPVPSWTPRAGGTGCASGFCE
jgi:hypothetical protein